MSESFLGWRRPAKAWLQLNRGEKGPRLRRPAVTCGPEFRLRQHRGKEVGSDGGVDGKFCSLDHQFGRHIRYKRAQPEKKRQFLEKLETENRR